MRNRWVRRLTLLLGVILAALVLTGCRKSVSLMEYVDLEYGGFDGKGTVEGSFDTARFMKDYEIAKEYQSSIEKIKVKTNAKKNLSNGDKIVVSIIYNSSLEDSLKMKFTDVSAQFTVDGLSEGEPFDAFENVKVSIDGYSGYATAAFTVEDPRLTEENFTLEAANNGSLANGDVVKIILQIEDEEAFLDETGLVPEAHELEVKVEGLEEAPVYNYFNDLLVGFVGRNTEGNLDLILLDSGKIDISEFAADKTSGLTNGDQITVTLDKEDRYYLETYGSVPEIKSLSYDVEGLPDAVTKVSDVDDAALEDMQKSVERYFKNYVKDYWSEDESLTSLTYKGAYLKYSTDPEASPQNVFWLIYEVKVKNKDIDADFTYYWTIGYNNLEFNSDGTIEVVKKGYLKISDGKGDGALTSSIQVGNFKYYGYENLDDLLDAIDKLIGLGYQSDDSL